MRWRATYVWLLATATLVFQPLKAQHHQEQHDHDAHAVEHVEDAHHDAHHGDAEEAFDPSTLIMHHIADAHEFHAWGDHESGFTLPLPVILWTEGGLVTFLSSEFHHDDAGTHVVEKNGQRLVKYHEKIYYAADVPNDHGAYVSYAEGDDHAVTNARPLDFSITKNVFSLLMSALVLILLFSAAGRSYKNGLVARGIGSFLEPLVIFVRDEIARPNIGEERYKKFMPYLLTLFFFIWMNNLIGLIPFFPFSSNLTGNIAVTFTLAFMTLIVTNVSANGGYWKHIFMPPVPWPLWIVMIPVELIGVISKPFALMVRLFANITAGHIIILSLTSLIFIFQSMAIAPVSVVFVLFMNFIELLVAALQAYIFTLLSALFIGLAHVDEHH